MDGLLSALCCRVIEKPYCSEIGSLELEADGWCDSGHLFLMARSYPELSMGRRRLVGRSLSLVNHVLHKVYGAWDRGRFVVCI